MGYFEDCWNTAPAGELLQYSFFFRGGFAAFGFDFFNEPDCGEIGFDLANLASRSEVVSIIRKSKCSTDFKRNDFLKKNEAYPLGALRSLKFAYRKLRISLFVELAV